ncbi:hypothetical protein EXIGLDRAFT_724059 [Exidia glandulosa HHB12029]|uniref:Uncharacterized protein n=1 Tax=Exidia glandulosa HHB12029 TaxID=1314781 RepID=A0A165EJW7_EXIGL|nr:hypothetical protein EXIGLDRAFT_724059 [Exidia glandulosa HHB12029]
MAHEILAQDSDLQRIGDGIVREFVANGAQLFLYGVYVLLISISLSVLLRQRRCQTSRSLVVVMVSMFAISTFLWISTTVTLIIRIKITLIGTTLRTMDERLQLANASTTKLSYAANMVFLVNCLIGDSMLTWRVHTLCTKMRLVVSFLGAILLAMLAVTVGYLICSTKAGIPAGRSLQPPTCPNIWFSGLVISAVLNTVATALLVILAWRHRQLTSQTWSRKTEVDRVLAILAICGLVYLVFFIAGNLVPYYLPATPVSLGLGTVGNNAFYQLTGMYPNAVTVLATRHEVIFGAVPTDSDVAAIRSASIHFRPNTASDGDGDGDIELGVAEREVVKSSYTGRMYES